MKNSKIKLLELGLWPRWKLRIKHNKLDYKIACTTQTKPANVNICNEISKYRCEILTKSMTTENSISSRPLEKTFTTSNSIVEELDLNILFKYASSCVSCKLCETRTTVVFGSGNAKADWLFVGEAPGANEDIKGEPFVGQAGKLLDNMLRSINIDRRSGAYITNVVKCRPPKNRDPLPEEISACEIYLKNQIMLIQPKIIIALGRFAAQVLLCSKDKISLLRQHVHEYREIAVVVTYHPAYLLRSLEDKSKTWEDLQFARNVYRERISRNI